MNCLKNGWVIAGLCAVLIGIGGFWLHSRMEVRILQSAPIQHTPRSEPLTLSLCIIVDHWSMMCIGEKHQLFADRYAVAERTSNREKNEMHMAICIGPYPGLCMTL